MVMSTTWLSRCQCVLCHFTSLYFNLWKTFDKTQTIYQYMSLNNCLSKKFLESRLVVNTSSCRLGLRLYEWVLRSGKIQRRTCWSFDKAAATNRHPNRQQADPQWNRLGDKNWDGRSDAWMLQVVVCRMNSQSPTMRATHTVSWQTRLT